MKGYGKSRKLNINLNDSDAIQNAFDSLVGLENITAAARGLMERLVADGTEYARDIVPVDTGELRDGISGEVSAEGTTIKGVVKVESDHAAYVEFGVGVVGQGTYPGDTDGYEYNVPSEFKDETGGWTYGNNYTHGYPANPFMFHTSREMQRRAPEIAKEILHDYQK